MSKFIDSNSSTTSTYRIAVVVFHRILQYICMQHNINVLSKKERPVVFEGQLPRRKIHSSELSLCIYSIHETQRDLFAKYVRDERFVGGELEVTIGIIAVLHYLLQLVGLEPIKILIQQGIIGGEEKEQILAELTQFTDNTFCISDYTEQVSPEVQPRLSELVSQKRARETGSVKDRFINQITNRDVVPIRILESLIRIFNERNLSIEAIAEKYANKVNNQRDPEKPNFYVTPLEWSLALVVALRLPIGDLIVRGESDLAKLDASRIDHRKDYSIHNFAFAAKDFNRIDQRKKKHKDLKTDQVTRLKKNVKRQLELLNNLSLLRKYM